MLSRQTWLTLAVLTLAPPSYAADVTPIFVGNTLPIIEGSGLAAPKPAELLEHNDWQLAIYSNLQSHANDAGSATETLIIDAEVHSLSGQLRWGFAPEWEAGITLKTLRVTAGGLDGVIDDWHDFFGLDDGDRVRLPEDQLRVYYDDGASNRLIEDAQSGLGDTQLSLSYQVPGSERLYVAAHFGANLPTGSAERLLGSDKIDFSASVSFGSAAQNRLGWHANFGVLALGDESLFGTPTKSAAWFSSFGTHWQASQHWRWSAQVDGHSDVLESSIPEINRSAWQLALAGEYAWRNKQRRVQLYLTEDLTVNGAADFSTGLNFIFSR